MAFSATSNRGMSGFPSEYLQNWGAYNPFPNQGGGGLTGKAARNANAAQNVAYAQGGGGGLLGSLSPYSLSTAGSAFRPGNSNSTYRPGKARWGPGAPGTNLIDRYAGASPAGGGGGTTTTPTTTTPTTTTPATPSATQQMGTDLQALLAGYTNPIVNGGLSDATIAQAMATLNGGMPAWATQQFGGNFAQNLQQDVGRAGINLQRGAAEQQASMDLAQQRARAGAGLDMAGLLAQLNQQNVMHDLNMKSGGIGAISGLLGGLF